MLGNYQFNSIYNSVPIPPIVTEDIISYNGFGIQDQSVITQETNLYDTGDAEYNTFNIPQRDGRGFINKWYRGKQIYIRGIIRASTMPAMESIMDKMKTAFTVQGNKALHYYHSGEKREIFATCTGIKFDRKFYHVTFCPFEITLETEQAFAHSYLKESQYYPGQANSISTTSFTSTSGDISYPKVYFICAGTSSNISVTIGGITISYTGSVVSGDIICFDSENLIVTKNGVSVNYTGFFPSVQPGQNNFSTSLGTAISYDLIILYNRNFK